MAAPRYCMPDRSAVMTNELIISHIERGSRVIDLGCGDGRLLSALARQHGASVLGVELDQKQFQQAVARGVPCICANLDDGLPDIPDRSFDFAILSQTLQQVRHPKFLLQEMMRIAQRVLVVVPNFGYWRVRWQVLRYGRAPVTQSLPYEWYSTPNLHVMTMHDVRDLATLLKIRIVQERPIVNGRAVDRAWLANLRADSALYLFERTEK